MAKGPTQVDDLVFKNTLIVKSDSLHCPHATFCARMTCREWRQKGMSQMNFSVFVLCLLIGCVAGLRSMMAPAILCAAAYLQWVHLEGTPFAFFGWSAMLWIFTLAAIGELIYDKLPVARARTEPLGLVTRAITGGLCGAALTASERQNLVVGALLGAIGGVAGAFAGYNIRHGIVTHVRLPDFVVAVIEDLLALSGGLFVASRM